MSRIENNPSTSLIIKCFVFWVLIFTLINTFINPNHIKLYGKDI